MREVSVKITGLLMISILTLGIIQFSAGNSTASALDTALKTHDNGGLIFDRSEQHSDRGAGIAPSRPRYADWTSRDCEKVSFSPEDPLASPAFSLESKFYERVCEEDPIDDYERCWDSWIHTERRMVSVSIENRTSMYPWEKDIFEVCLSGYILYADVKDASHEYDLKHDGENTVTVKATAIRKIAANPDSKGISVDVFKYERTFNRIRLALSDKWHAYYAGEATEITAILKKKGFGRTSKVIAKKKARFSAADSYSIEFSNSKGELKEKLRPGSKYFIEWGFKRIGDISKPTQIKDKKTETITIPR
ncbi:hypothetical protein ACFL6Y_03910 [Elusimicrobiota bacterium]